MATLIFWLAIVAMVASIVLLVQMVRLIDTIWVAGPGRVFYLSWVALTVWMDLVVLYFLTNTIWPDWFGPTDHPRRDWVRLFFVAYLAAYAIGASIAAWRVNKHLRKPGMTVADQHAETMKELRHNTGVSEATLAEAEDAKDHAGEAKIEAKEAKDQATSAHQAAQRSIDHIDRAMERMEERSRKEDGEG